MASASMSKSTVNEEMPNLENIEFPEAPPETAPTLGNNNNETSDSDDENNKKDEDKKKDEKNENDEKDEKKEEEVKPPKNGIIGLNNMGNTCYLNAVIQVISNMDEFRGFLLDGEFLEDLKPEVDESLYKQLYKIVRYLWESSSDSLTPKSFREKFIERQKQFFGYEQQDSNEAIQFLLDILHEETAKKITTTYTMTPEMTIFTKILDDYFNWKSTMTEVEKAERKIQIRKIIQENKVYSVDYFAMKYLNELTKSYSSICDFFGIINCQLKKCPECNHIKYNFEQNYMLHVTLPELDDEFIKKMEIFPKLLEMKIEELKEKVSNEELISKLCINEIRMRYTYQLDDLLVSNQVPEIMDENNLWNCNNCSKKVKAIAYPKLLKTPKYLIIHFKRFKHVVQNGDTFIVKIKNYIKYNKYINIKNLMLKESDDVKYELISGITHMGEYNGGHFTSFALNNKKWYSYNDSRASEIKIDKDDIPQSPNAYMLIYKRSD